MSKVVRGVKNITKGYSSVQVKVRNGKRQGETIRSIEIDEKQLPPMIHGVQQGPTWLRSRR